MKKKSLLLTAVATIGLTVATMAQNVPSYVPTNGLVGWWPFNGNANDESGNGNNGTVNGAILTADRFGNSNMAYSFDGIDNYIQVQTQSQIAQNSNYSWSFWFNSLTSDFNGTFIGSYTYFVKLGHVSLPGLFYKDEQGNETNTFYVQHYFNVLPLSNFWNHLVVVKSGNTIEIFLNGLSIGSTTTYGFANFSPNHLTKFGNQYTDYYNGKLDDIGIWNRALSQQEISDLYNAVNCVNNTTITPQIYTLETGSTANFTATTSDPNPSYVWQSNFGQDFQTLNDFGNYSGTNTSTLSISNVQLANHNEPIRVITTSGECIDTSEVATISILDTCITLINDTTYITVTDTLLINTLITGINPPNNSNTIKVYPNPANSHITIEYGDFVLMNGYQLRIENSIGQEVFQTSITQQSDYLNLDNWGGNGLYFVHIVDPQGNTIDIRKIVLQ